ncbi:hypothetical protein FISHEDRAFT_70958 [Fistulina hepatica ATCC 64428]|uniref:BZIP domain-containing protein n=1 Tax=Fistulina hepatica ATCC 64428 TaxID=1128425 RepID=A0A0D7AKL2_9AGAR|nr:hypothetical protein FISHEDRAFT_70958 [Fistulina hepatica ATCC 64428]
MDVFAQGGLSEELFGFTAFDPSVQADLLFEEQQIFMDNSPGNTPPNGPVQEQFTSFTSSSSSNNPSGDSPSFDGAQRENHLLTQLAMSAGLPQPSVPREQFYAAFVQALHATQGTPSPASGIHDLPVPRSTANMNSYQAHQASYLHRDGTQRFPPTYSPQQQYTYPVLPSTRPHDSYNLPPLREPHFPTPPPPQYNPYYPHPRPPPAPELSSYNFNVGPSRSQRRSSVPAPSPPSQATSNISAARSEDSYSSANEEKRRRNTAASARFRIKKKERTLNLERSVSDLEGRAEDLEREAADLRRENSWLKEMVMLKGSHIATASAVGRGEGSSSGDVAAPISEADEHSERSSDRSDNEGLRRRRKRKQKGKAKANNRGN